MHITFICGSLAPGKDGVGDYSRRLAGELIREGHSASLIALYDGHCTKIEETTQLDAEVEIPVLRLPKTLSKVERLQATQAFIAKQKPDVMSLQYVPYAFQDKGLPFWLPSFLKQKLFKGKWHVMFHELWLGEKKEDSFKDQLIGKLQQFISKKLIKAVNPAQIHTSMTLYQQFLQQRLSIKADILPLFSNINKIDDNLIDSKKWDINRNEYFCIVNFGSYYYQNWDLEQDLDTLIEYASPKKLLLVALGKIGDEAKQRWDSYAKEGKIETLTTGPLTDGEINEWFIHHIDLGIVTTPVSMLGKSGSYMVFRDFHIPILAHQDTFHFRLPLPNGFWKETHFEYEELNQLIRVSEKKKYEITLKEIGQEFIKSLQ